MTDSDQFFHFTLGPVQGFVSQARRTRDFWAGSFLLSWLAGVAMCEVQRQGGEIKFPVPADNYLGWIKGEETGTAPRQGGIPNRFKSVCAKVPGDFDGALVASTVREAWIALAEHVWDKDELTRWLAADDFERTRSIWDRQNSAFWDISWVLTPSVAESSVLDQRKNWRTHHSTPEPGVKCMLMDGWQELSGQERPGEAHKAFWKKLRKDMGAENDFGEKEALCTLAYVKRRFARHFEFFEATLTSGLKIKGWELASTMPSVSYMAAVHWLKALIQTGTPDEVKELLVAARAVNPSYTEWDTDIACLREATKNWPQEGAARKILALDGNLFFKHVRNAPKQYGYAEDLVKNLDLAISRFGKNHPEFEQIPLSPFYAVLMMDGDSLGQHMSDKDKQGVISAALNTFTAAVPSLIEKHNGQLIYAGGDDVLALLPLEDALPCAAAVRAKYQESFQAASFTASISAAIEFAHVKTPLGLVLGDAHKLLDDVAKEGAGRDAVAVRVWKTSGQVLQWAQPWDIALQGAKFSLVEMAKDWDKGTGDLAAASNKFFFKIDERFSVLNPPKTTDSNDSTGKSILNSEQAEILLAVDLVNSGDNRIGLSVYDARQRIRPLLEQCRPVKRVPDPASGELKLNNDKPDELRLEVDGALLLRFLASKGVDFGDDK